MCSYSVPGSVTQRVCLRCNKRPAAWLRLSQVSWLGLLGLGLCSVDVQLCSAPHLFWGQSKLFHLFSRSSPLPFMCMASKGVSGSRASPTSASSHHLLTYLLTVGNGKLIHNVGRGAKGFYTLVFLCTLSNPRMCQWQSSPLGNTLLHKHSHWLQWACSWCIPCE